MIPNSSPNAKARLNAIGIWGCCCCYSACAFVARVSSKRWLERCILARCYERSIIENELFFFFSLFFCGTYTSAFYSIDKNFLFRPKYNVICSTDLFERFLKRHNCDVKAANYMYTSGITHSIDRLREHGIELKWAKMRRNEIWHDPYENACGWSTYATVLSDFTCKQFTN